MMRRTLTVGVGLVVSAMLLAPVAHAAPGKVVQLTSQQLTEAGFPTTPNTTSWGKGTANLSTNSAPQWQDVVITGKAPSYTQPGQLLTMARFLPSDTQGSGTLKPLNITAVVQPDQTYTMHFQLGVTGTWGYAVGYQTTGANPERVGFQFQFTTTGSDKSAPTAGKATAVTLSAGKLAKAGFTKTPNVVGWGGTATLSTNKAKAGAPVTISGKAPAELKPGTTLTLERFVPTDKLGSGAFEPVGNTATVVKADGTYELTFELNQKGRYGYTFGAGLDEEWIGVEFQLKTT